MIKLSNSKILSFGVVLLSLLLVAKLISLMLLWILPSEGVDLNLKKSYTSKYQRVDFKNMLQGSSSKTVQKVVHKPQNTYSINNMILTGLYGNKKHGFAIVAKKTNIRKTTIVGIGESFEGYTLSDVRIDEVVFTRSGKEYVLKLAQKSKLKNNRNYVTKVQTASGAGEYQVHKSDIDYYAKHPSQIWKDIAISEVRRNGIIEGFRVNRIRRNSKMAQIGLKVGDVIIKANNVELKSYRDAMKLYNERNKIDTLELVVLRDNQEKEIIYEIR